MVLNVMSTNNHIDSHHMYLPLFMFDMNPKWNMYMKEVDTIPTRNGRELGEIWVSKVGTNF